MFKFLVLNPSDKGDEIIKKANMQHDRNGFESTILLDKISSSSAKFTIPAYYKQPTGDVSQNDDNTNTVGVEGIIKLKCGITLGFVDEEDALDYDGRIDILITSKWPSKLMNKVHPETVSMDFKIDNLVSKYKPRYIFSTGEFHEYGPFQFEEGTCCRFISLHREGEGKWFYAFNFPLIPNDPVPQDLVANPFVEETNNKRKPDDTESQPVPKKAKVVLPQDCFFCLSNPKVETHMIISIEKSVYMTVAKGPLTRSNAQMPFSGHGIFIPVEHLSLTTATVEEEMSQLEAKMYKQFKENYPDLTLISFDLNLSKNVHYHKQFLPINKKYLEEGNFQKVLSDKCQINNEKYLKNHKLNFEKVENVDISKQFIRFEVFEDETPQTYVNYIEDDSKIIDLQFPRRVLSYIIRSPKRLYWDKCQQPRGKETQDCEEFKNFWNQTV